MSLRHPALRSRVRARFYPFLPVITTDDVPRLPLRVVDGGDWAEAVETELQQPFPAGGPLARVVLVRRASDFDLVLVSDHMLADAMSYAYLVRDILDRLARPDLPVTVQESPQGWDVLTRLQPPKKPEPPGPVLPPTVNETDNPAGRFTVSYRVWDAERSAALVRRCREEGTTVHAALATALLRALAQLEEGHPVRRLGSPISVRHWLPERYRAGFGGYVGPSTMVAVNTSVESGFWEAARSFKATLTARSSPMAFRRAEQVLRILYRLPSRLARVAVRRWLNDEYDAWLSNLTRLPIPTHYGPYHLTALHLAINTGGVRRRVVGVAELGGRICLTAASSSGPLMEKALDLMADEKDS